jgi:hypothetical protein
MLTVLTMLVHIVENYVGEETMSLTSLARSLVASLLLIPVAGSALAQAPFYQGKQVKVLVGFSPGGGTDLFGRLIAEGLGQHIAGRPAVIVQNMPGAGSVVASNFFSQRAPRDGTVLLIGTGQLLLRIVLGLDGAKSKANDLEPLIASPMGRIAYVRTSAGVPTAKALLNPGEPLIVGVPEVIATLDTVLGLKALDVKFRAVTGYPGKNDTRMALERGEVNVDGQATPVYNSSVLHMIKSGVARPIFAQGLMDGDKLVRDPAAPDIPSVAEVYVDMYGKPPEGPAWEAYKASVRAFGNAGKILMTHPDIPPAAMAALNHAVDAMAKDAAFVKSAETVLEGYSFQTGQPLRDGVSAIGRTDPATITWLQNMLSADFNMKFN